MNDVWIRFSGLRGRILGQGFLVEGRIFSKDFWYEEADIGCF